ncbi:response regulator [Paenibacillus ehimensis]|uniref:response regulator n=1 Tax=Paenibacillus ehimensis TaxID=79264 RepID=UPI002DB7CE0F|nr:response regulator [Paenibacillus ehimensis]MEC0208163.1 response regulator [Paenibacillus ehimensis]
MRAILVDDEHLALIGLKKAMEREASEVEIVATYSDSTKVMAGVLLHRPDVVFLDIHMPDINGLNLGKQIQTVVPGIEIVFVTSYDKYAVQAFELYALDYIMKPLQKDRLRQTILRIKEKLSIRGTKKTHDVNSPLICCFNQLQFRLPGMNAQNAKWRTSKAQELFAYLLHHRDRTINRSVLLELLWPELEETKAAQHLYTTIYHIRQTLKNSNMDTISINSGNLEAGYKLDLGEARVDTEEWEYAMRQLGVLDASTADAYEHVLNLYKGDYLGNYDYLWAEHERERLRLLWLYHMRKLCMFYEQQENQKKAIQVHLRIQQLLPDEEESYFSLMKLYDAIGDKIGVEEQYLLLRTKMERDLELPISADITDWYTRWKSVSLTS